jgi:hypothetical protein
MKGSKIIPMLDIIHCMLTSRDSKCRCKYKETAPSGDGSGMSDIKAE